MHVMYIFLSRVAHIDFVKIREKKVEWSQYNCNDILYRKWYKICEWTHGIRMDVEPEI